MAWRRTDSALPHRIQAAAVLHEQLQPGAIQDADPRPRLGLRLPRRHRHRRVLRLGPAAQSRHHRAAPAAHAARRRLRAQASALLGSPISMVQAGRSGGYWRSVRDLPKRTPLRVKLITALLALVALALVVISIAGIAILKDNLLGPYDSQLQGPLLSHEATSAVSSYLQTGQTYTGQSFAVDWIPANGSAHAVVLPFSQSLPRGNFPNPTGSSVTHAMSGPIVQASHDWIGSHLNRPFTVGSQNGPGRWRVLVETVPLSNGSTGTIVLALDVSSVYTTIGQLATIDFLVS